MLNITNLHNITNTIQILYEKMYMLLTGDSTGLKLSLEHPNDTNLSIDSSMYSNSSCLKLIVTF